jgi:hypothetical protein
VRYFDWPEELAVLDEPELEDELDDEPFEEEPFEDEPFEDLEPFEPFGGGAVGKLVE